MEMSKNICLFFGSEENGYEEDFLGEFPNVESAKDSLADYLREDGLESEIPNIDETGWEGESLQGYHYVYVIGEKAFCLSVLTGLREDFLEMFDEDE
jgi:hypothetical protein